ncbi:MAG: hypothetical protein H0U50_03830, partial [Pyrinomonadaceae bacterium]|nr:hypothetical protein [Pyrinomonadaceae bacterium]
MLKNKLFTFLSIFPLLLLFFDTYSAQNKSGQTQKVRTVTIPVSIFTKRELKDNQTEELVQAERLLVKENNDEQTILSIRSVTNTPLALAVLIQDDLTSNFNLQL